MSCQLNPLTPNCYCGACLTHHFIVLFIQLSVRSWCLCMSLQSQPGQQHGLQTKYREWASGAPGCHTHRKQHSQLHQQSNSEYHCAKQTGQSHGPAAPETHLDPIQDINLTPRDSGPGFRPLLAATTRSQPGDRKLQHPQWCCSAKHASLPPRRQLVPEAAAGRNGPHGRLVSTDGAGDQRQQAVRGR